MLIRESFFKTLLVYLRPGSQPAKNFGWSKAPFGNDHDVIDVQSTMMRLFCYEQLTNISGGTFFIVGGAWASAGRMARKCLENLKSTV